MVGIMGSLKIGLSKIVVVVAIVLVVVVVVGVWAYYVQQQGASKKLVVLARSGTYAEGLKIAAEEYQKRTGVEVVVQELGYKELHDKLAMEVIQKTGAYDVVMLDDPWLAEFASQGFLEDIGGMLEAKGVQVDPDFVPTTIEVCKYKGKLYALPYVGNVQLFVYREDLFEKYGLPEPKTWDDVLKAAKTIYEGERGKVYGYVIRGKKGNPVVTNFLPIFWGYGARIVDEMGRPTVYSDEAIKALKTFLELKDYAPPGVENYNSPEIKAALYNGQTAMSIVWPAWVPALEDPEKSKVAGKVVVTTTPGAKPMIGAWLLGIPSTSKNKDLALDFILFVLSRDMQKKLALEAGVPPTRASVYLDDEVKAKYPWYPVQLEALKDAQPRPRLPQWSKVEDILANYIHQALTGALTPEEALKKAQEELEKLLKS